MTLAELMQFDNITAAWFWTTSEDAGPYAENERFDVVFVRETDTFVGGGYHERRTLYVQGVITAQKDSRRENGGRIVKGDPQEVLARVIADAHEASQYGTFPEWAEDTRDHSGDYLQALADMEDYRIHRERHHALTAWLGESYDEYVKAAQEYNSEH